MSGVMPHIGKEGEIFALGQTWKLGRFDVSVWDELLEWFKRRLPDPFAGLQTLAVCIPKDAPPDHPVLVAFNRAFSEAQRKAATIYSIDAPEFHEAIDNTLDGKVERFRLLLKRNHPDITRQQALEILQELG